MNKKLLCLFVLLFAFSKKPFANNLSITNIATPTTTTVTFDISWDNSWNTAAPSNNWDAVWVFVKTQVCATGSSPWLHAPLSTVSAQHSVTGGVLQVDAVTDGMGVFIRRSANGSGNIATSSVTLKFSGAYTIASTNYEVLGIEMVNVPQGSFYIGDASTATNQSQYSLGALATGYMYQVNSEATIAQDVLWNPVWAGSIGAHAAIIAAYPKGFNAFYCMKYEISQQQYTAFLNLLDFNQQINRTIVSPASATGTAALVASSGDNRNSIEIKTPGTAFAVPAVYGNDLNGNNTYDEAADGGNIACNYLSWDDLRAYLDWSALRPMSEFEFEKAARGTNFPINVEYAWSSTTINQAISNSLNNSGLTNETSTSTLDGLCAYNAGASATLGPLRVGFAATSSTIRTQAGASFYGAMDMGGNLWEQCFQCGWYNGTRTSVPIFNGTLGDGNLDASGNMNIVSWGGTVAQSIVRGGNWEYSAQRSQISDRFYVNSTAENATRVRRTGGRGVR